VSGGIDEVLLPGSFLGIYRCLEPGKPAVAVPDGKENVAQAVTVHVRDSGRAGAVPIRDLPPGPILPAGIFRLLQPVSVLGRVHASVPVYVPEGQAGAPAGQVQGNRFPAPVRVPE